MIEAISTHSEYQALIASLCAERFKSLTVGNDCCPWHAARKLRFIGEYHYEVSAVEIYSITLHRCLVCGKKFYQDGLADEYNIA